MAYPHFTSHMGETKLFSIVKFWIVVQHHSIYIVLITYRHVLEHNNYMSYKFYSIIEILQLWTLLPVRYSWQCSTKCVTTATKNHRNFKTKTYNLVALDSYMRSCQITVVVFWDKLPAYVLLHIEKRTVGRYTWLYTCMYFI